MHISLFSKVKYLLKTALPILASWPEMFILKINESLVAYCTGDGENEERTLFEK